MARQPAPRSWLPFHASATPRSWQPFPSPLRVGGDRGEGGPEDHARERRRMARLRAPRSWQPFPSPIRVGGDRGEGGPE